ncbi:cation:dicarboxylase symporter family transporter [Synechococcus sp. RSCCF101]|uniref:cation:dicarboxylate symporter family transporter n=1 Tax=Synechococcus sp. RSCCF101 TaxID=2511069 RepID=UPI001245313B|nr:cation:dicarboxylase symporter family transporter [Synechococcus sp. RSCCF101]QEY31236.1 cation:dicarboxylase symporter family transporter [Synechococcus sp. RSCCF101]
MNRSLRLRLQLPWNYDLPTQVLLGFILGILAGILVGEMAESLQFIGDIYIRLIQMPVLPYIITSLVAGLGKLDYREARTLFTRAGFVMVVLWSIVIFQLLIVPLAFPAWDASSFFSSSLLNEAKAISFLDLFVPSNPFAAMAQTIIPAVVLFSITLGLAIIGIPEKGRLVEYMDGLTRALTRIVNFVARLSPIGVFAISASAAGTLNPDDFGRLQVYIVVQAAMALFLSFWVLPGLITILTGISYRKLLTPLQTSLVTAFATANLLIVLPSLVETSQRLFKELASSTEAEEGRSAIEVLVPTSFNFPSTGRLLTLFFLPFAAWYGGSQLPWNDYPVLISAGIASLFGSSVVSVQFLLDSLQLPADMLQLYIAADVSSSRFTTLVAAVHTVAIALLGTCAMTGSLKFPRRRLIRFSLATVLLNLMLVGIIQVGFTYGFSDGYTKDQLLKSLGFLRARPSSPAPVDRSFLTSDSQWPSAANANKAAYPPAVLRACYKPNTYPLAFTNNSDQLVGFNIEMAYLMAKSLERDLTLVPIPSRVRSAEELASFLRLAQCNISVNETPVTPDRIGWIDFAPAIKNYSLGFVMPDYARGDFSDWTKIKRLGSVRIGVTADVPYYETLLQTMLPEAKLIAVDSPDVLLDPEKSGYLDALATSAETGSAWTLLHPSYGVTIPKPLVSVPVAYPLPKTDDQLNEIISTWVRLKLSDRTIDDLFGYWIEGNVDEVTPPRWSVLRDVLGWVH